MQVVAYVTQHFQLVVAKACKIISIIN